MIDTPMKCFMVAQEDGTLVEYPKVSIQAFRRLAQALEAQLNNPFVPSSTLIQALGELSALLEHNPDRFAVWLDVDDITRELENPIGYLGDSEGHLLVRDSSSNPLSNLYI
jgi:hypothetical protein